MGAARNLPGQGGGFEVDGSFGFCAHCGFEHRLTGRDSAPVAEADGASAMALEDGNASGADAEDGAAVFGTLGKEEQQAVEQLKRRDREVRTHEHAHVAAGGQYVRGGIQYEYETGPDGKRYAVGGEVSIDTTPVSGDPEATIRKAQTIRRAALAPAQPSAQDRRAAAAASQMEARARQEMLTEQRQEMGEVSENTPGVLAGVEGVDAGLTDLPKASASGPPVAKLAYAHSLQESRRIDVYG